MDGGNNMPVQDQMSGGDHVHMLAAAAAMSMPGQIDGVQGSGAAGEPQLVQVVAAAPMQAHYIQQGVGIEEEQGGVGDGGGGAGDGGASGGMVVEVAAEQEQQVGVATRSQTANQLTLSFQGEVYVFESVSPEKGKVLSTDLSSHISPALVFFHIPIPEVRQLWYKEIVGQFQEAVACSFVNAGVLQTLVSMGDVKAVFMGHDHTNDLCGEMEGIWFCYGGGIGYHGYGKVGWPRRARVILAELESGQKAWMGVERIKTWKRLDDENLSRIDEQVLWVKQTPNR